MSLVSVSYSLNQTYFVSEDAFYQAVKKAANISKFTKAISLDICHNDETNDFKVCINAKIKQGASIKTALLELQKNIDDYSLNLIDSKPQNVTIIIEGEF